METFNYSTNVFYILNVLKEKGKNPALWRYNSTYREADNRQNE
jgi:hypothetical protein